MKDYHGGSIEPGKRMELPFPTPRERDFSAPYNHVTTTFLYFPSEQPSAPLG